MKGDGKMGKNFGLCMLLLIASASLYGCLAQPQTEVPQDKSGQLSPVLDTEYTTMTGRYLQDQSGEHLMISSVNNAPFVLENEAGDDAIFDQLTPGDEIEVAYEFIKETYPAQLPIYQLKKLTDGEMKDIPTQVLADLEELGRKFEK